MKPSQSPWRVSPNQEELVSRCLKQRIGSVCHHGNSVSVEPPPHPTCSEKQLKCIHFTHRPCNEIQALALIACSVTRKSHRICDTSLFPLTPAHTHANCHTLSFLVLFSFLFLTAGAFIEDENIHFIVPKVILLVQSCSEELGTSWNSVAALNIPLMWF